MSRGVKDWFDRSPFGPPDANGNATTEHGLRFRCTMCGTCCSGPPGTVMLDADERAALAMHLSMSEDAFVERYTKPIDDGVSLSERMSAFGWDCVFLDRTTIPGKAICGVYEARPQQCRTWPFWKRNLVDERSWDRASATCPGMNAGPLTPARAVRLTRDASPI